LILINDYYEIPHVRLADWIAMIGSAVAYLIFAIVVFGGLRFFVRRTRMRLLGNVIAVLFLVAGLVGYWVVFVTLDSATYTRAFKAAEVAHRPVPDEEARLKWWANERARSIFLQRPWIKPSRTGFDVLPVVAVALAAMLVRAKTER
jgi:hypothetical protein